MGIKGTIKRLAENLTGTYILKSLPRGVSPFHDIAVALPGYRLTIEQPTSGPERLSFAPTDPTPFSAPRRRRSNTRPGDKL